MVGAPPAAEARRRIAVACPRGPCRLNPGANACVSRRSTSAWRTSRGDFNDAALYRRVGEVLSAMNPVRMNFSYADYFGLRPSTGYETLVYDAMTGESTLFHRADIVEAGWAAVEPLLAAWEDGRADLHTYPAGSWGPKAADALMERDGREWRRYGDRSR